MFVFQSILTLIALKIISQNMRLQRSLGMSYFIQFVEMMPHKPPIT